MDTLSAIKVPDDAGPFKRAEDRRKPYLDDPETAAVFAGPVLTHSDWTPDNVLVSEHRAWLIDWAWPALCAACYAGGALGVIGALTLMGSDWYDNPMEAVVDQAGRIVLPKFIRDALGLLPGTKVDISPYGAGVQVVPAGRTARLVEEDGVLVSAGDTPVNDDILFGLIDAGRK